MRLKLRMPKLPKLKTKTVGILVIAAVVLIVLASQISMDGFQNSTSPAVAAAQTNLANAQAALQQAQSTASQAAAAVMAKTAALQQAQSALQQAQAALQQAQAAIPQAQAALAAKTTAVTQAQAALQAAIAAQAAAVAPPTNTGCPPPGNQIWVPFHETCPPCFKDMGFDWSRFQKRCQVPNAPPPPPPPSQPTNTGCPPKGTVIQSPGPNCPPCFTNVGSMNVGGGFMGFIPPMTMCKVL